MDKAKRKRLEAKGWRFGTVEEFLQLTPEESRYIEMKLALSRKLNERRREKKMTRRQLARLLKSSQSQVAEMEEGDPSVSLDLLVRSLLYLGAQQKDLARMISA